jgi:prophage DNA circulation protein
VSWRDDLQPASLNGVRFGVLGDEARFGRKTVLHEYPMRDKPYAEDLGRAARRISITGFLIEDSLVYGGGSVTAQRDALVAAAETAGPATLVHPTLGRLTVNLPEDGLAIAERWDAGRYMEIRLCFPR